MFLVGTALRGSYLRFGVLGIALTETSRLADISQRPQASRLVFGVQPWLFAGIADRKVSASSLLPHSLHAANLGCHQLLPNSMVGGDLECLGDRLYQSLQVSWGDFKRL